MFSKDSFINRLTHAPYYKAVSAWIRKNSDPFELQKVIQRHPDYKGSLLKYYIDQAAVIYVKMKSYDPDEIIFQSRCIHFEEGDEYIYRPLSKLPLLGAIWCVIAADTCRFEDDKIKARHIMEQMEMISTEETNALRQEVINNLPTFDDFGKQVQFIIDETEMSLHPQALADIEKHFKRIAQIEEQSSQSIPVKKIHKTLELTIVGARYCMPGETNDDKTTAARTFLSSLPASSRFILSRRPDNPYNPNAVASVLETDGNHYGYVSDEQLYQIIPLLDEFGQCEATLSHTDDHVTYWVEVNVPEEEDIPDFHPNTQRVLTECPLPHKFMFESQPAELKMDVFPLRFVKIVINDETLPELYQKAQMLLDCFNSSLCRNDAHWQREIQKKIQHVYAYVKKHFSEDEKTECNNPKVWYELSDRCRDLIGDYHRSDGHGAIIEKQFSLLVNSPQADKMVEKFNEHYQQDTIGLLHEMHNWIKDNLKVVYSAHLDWQELGHTIAYKKMCRAETYEILTVLVLLHKLYKPAAIKGATKNKKKSTPDKEHGIARDTFSCASHITDKHLDVLVQDMIQDKWLSNQTSKTNFRQLFSGKASDCEIVWTGEVGLGSLKELFTIMKEEKLITLPAGARSVNSVLENHVVDTQGHFIKRLNSSEAAGSSLQTIKKYINLLKARIQEDDIDKMFADLEQYDPSYY